MGISLMHCSYRIFSLFDSKVRIEFITEFDMNSYVGTDTRYLVIGLRDTAIILELLSLVEFTAAVLLLSKSDRSV